MSVGCLLLGKSSIVGFSKILLKAACCLRKQRYKSGMSEHETVKLYINRNVTSVVLGGVAVTVCRKLNFLKICAYQLYQATYTASDTEQLYYLSLRISIKHRFFTFLFMYMFNEQFIPCEKAQHALTPAHYKAEYCVPK